MVESSFMQIRGETMLRRTKNILKSLRNCRSGNAVMIVALGMPALIGGTGYAVDTAQWYLWKREVQFAVDQAAIAGAWAMTDSATSATYQTRAGQEFDANLSITDDFVSEPNIDLADYESGTDNSVVVTASASQMLPFSGFLTGKAATINVRAQATFEQGASYTACLLAVDPSATDAFILGGSVSGSAACGSGAISNASTAMRKNGNSGVNLGHLVSAGGIDSGFASNGTIHDHVSNLADPFDGLTMPQSTTPRTYTCPPVVPASTTTTADTSTSTVTSYIYVQANNASQSVSRATAGTNIYAYSSPKPSTTVPGTSQTGQTVPNGTTAGSQDGTATYVDMGQVLSSPKVREVKKTFTRTTYSNINTTTTPGSDGIARLSPGTYSSIVVGCQTILNPGVYVIQGDLDFGQNKSISGSDVMFILEQADRIKINSNSVVSLSGITQSTLQSDYGMSADDAAKLAGMVIYDPNSTEQLKMNGNATLALNGIIYMPQRNIWFNGNSTASGSCMMIVGGTLTFTGNNSLNSFCVPAGFSALDFGGSSDSVKLVS
ncbi:MAG: hypothetical protein H6914_08780 [Novosphingobium sp.]|nr:hypothetical protein [Novosphingobium sp.]